MPTAERQDGVFAEAFRVLRPGGTFAGRTAGPGLRFRLLHIRDTLNVVDPATLPARLEAAGFTDVAVAVHEGGDSLRFRARRP
ncbi:hypothetical protein P9869_32420 [Streptomyces ossamyceticus]|nr:hypothetical protein [Streptomyces ossamyceticus]